jgi:hypothetical protein
MHAALIRTKREQHLGKISDADAGKVGVGVVLGMERTEKIGGPGYFALFEKPRQ